MVDVLLEQQLSSRLRHRGKRNLSQAIYQILKDMIVTGELPIGHRINEQHLAQAFSVSRTPIRKALDLLVAEHLVESVENRGVIVTNVNENTIIEVFDLQLRLEQMMYSEAMRHITTEELSELMAHFTLMKTYENPLKEGRIQEVIVRLKTLVLKIAKSPILNNMLTELAVHMKRIASIEVDGWCKENGELDASDKGLPFMMMGNLRRQQIAVREQLLIFSCLARQEAETLDLALRRHIQNSKDAALTCYNLKMQSVLGEGWQGLKSNVSPAADNAPAPQSIIDAESLTIQSAQETVLQEAFICNEVECPLYASFQLMMNKPQKA